MIPSTVFGGVLIRVAPHTARVATVRAASLALCLFAACAPDPHFAIAQRQSAPIPGVDGHLARVSDIERGERATVEVLGPGGAVVARRFDAARGDTLPFAANGARWALVVERFEDHTTDADVAHLLVRQGDRAAPP